MWQLAKRLVRVCMRELTRTHGHNSHLRAHTHTHTLTAIFDLDVRHDHPGDDGAGGLDTGKV